MEVSAINPLECLTERRMLETMSICTSIMSSKNFTKLLQVFQPTLEFRLHSVAQRMIIGMLEHCLILMIGKGRTMEMVKLIGWILREEAKA